MTANPAQAFKILKKMGAPPGQLESATTFTLDSHENLTVEQAAENIAKHFSKLMAEFVPEIATLATEIFNNVHSQLHSFNESRYCD